MLHRLEDCIAWLSMRFNWVAAAAVALMVLVTCLDVVLRILRCPITGTYEVVGFLGAIFVSFSLAQTSLDRGHIAVDFFIRKAPRKIRVMIDRINAALCGVLFSLVSWQCFVNVENLKSAGEVSLTLQIPVYPFVMGTGIGCALLAAVLFLRVISTAEKEG